LLALCLLAAPASADTVESGDLVVRYSVINSLLIPAQVARANDIQRRGDRAIVTITLQQPSAAEPLHAIAADVTGHARTLLGERHELDFRRVEAHDSIYSLAIVALHEDEQTVTLDLVVTAQASGHSIPVMFTQELYRRR